MDTLFPVGNSRLAKLAIISYLVYFVKKKKGKVKEIYFLLAQYIVEFCLISKNLGDVAKILVDI